MSKSSLQVCYGSVWIRHANTSILENTDFAPTFFRCCRKPADHSALWYHAISPCRPHACKRLNWNGHEGQRWVMPKSDGERWHWRQASSHEQVSVPRTSAGRLLGINKCRTTIEIKGDDDAWESWISWVGRVLPWTWGEQARWAHRPAPSDAGVHSIAVSLTRRGCRPFRCALSFAQGECDHYVFIPQLRCNSSLCTFLAQGACAHFASIPQLRGDTSSTHRS